MLDEGMATISREYLTASGYRVRAPYKVIPGSAVFAVTNEAGGPEQLVAKLAASAADHETLATEIAALQFFARHGLCSAGPGPRVPRLVQVLAPLRIAEQSVHGFVVTRAPGRRLYEWDEMPEAWWRRVVSQSIDFIARLEALRVLHNDFWDSNIIADRRGDITVLDFQFTHHYVDQPEISSRAVLSNSESGRAERMMLGWTSRWHVGGDLNQLLGILDERGVLPPELADYVREHLLVRPGEEFPYATVHDNPAMSGAKLRSLLG